MSAPSEQDLRRDTFPKVVVVDGQQVNYDTPCWVPLRGATYRSTYRNALMNWLKGSNDNGYYLREHKKLKGTDVYDIEKIRDEANRLLAIAARSNPDLAVQPLLSAKNKVDLHSPAIQAKAAATRRANSERRKAVAQKPVLKKLTNMKISRELCHMGKDGTLQSKVGNSAADTRAANRQAALNRLTAKEMGIKTVKAPRVKKVKQTSGKRLSADDSDEHVEGTCDRILTGGANKGKYCNRKLIEGTDYCILHTPEKMKKLAQMRETGAANRAANPKPKKSGGKKKSSGKDEDKTYRPSSNDNDNRK